MMVAESRNWTEEEVHEAIAEIKREPGLWLELEHVERTTADFRGTEFGRREHRILVRLHPECTLSEITGLYWQIRDCRRSQLELK